MSASPKDLKDVIEIFLTKIDNISITVENRFRHEYAKEHYASCDLVEELISIFKSLEIVKNKDKFNDDDKNRIQLGLFKLSKKIKEVEWANTINQLSGTNTPGKVTAAKKSYENELQTDFKNIEGFRKYITKESKKRCRFKLLYRRFFPASVDAYKDASETFSKQHRKIHLFMTIMSLTFDTAFNINQRLLRQQASVSPFFLRGNTLSCKRESAGKTFGSMKRLKF